MTLGPPRFVALLFTAISRSSDSARGIKGRIEIVWVRRETRSVFLSRSLSFVVAMTTLTNAYQRSLGILAIASVYASPREPTISPHKNKQEIEKRAVDRGHKSRPRIPAAHSLSPPRPFRSHTPDARYCANKPLNNYFPAGDFSAGR